jgi:hypothetical protein
MDKLDFVTIFCQKFPSFCLLICSRGDTLSVFAQIWCCNVRDCVIFSSLFSVYLFLVKSPHFCALMVNLHKTQHVVV